MKIDGEASRHVIVFDCNIYLDAARLLGEPFVWNRFRHVVADLASVPVPHPKNEALDSLRALNVAYAGKFGDDTVEVWTSDHIDAMVRHVAEKGLGWSKGAAQALVVDLIHGLVDHSRGGIVAPCFPDGNPPLDHEDGMVLGACRVLAGEDPLSKVYCVTRDRGFVELHAKGLLGLHSQVIKPAALVSMPRRLSMQAALRRFPKARG